MTQATHVHCTVWAYTYNEQNARRGWSDRCNKHLFHFCLRGKTHSKTFYFNFLNVLASVTYYASLLRSLFRLSVRQSVCDDVRELWVNRGLYLHDLIGSRSANESSSSTPCWFSRHCTVCCRRISRMTSRYRAPSTPIVWRCDLFCPTDSLVSRRSLFRCGWTENMEQFAYQIATTRPQPWTI